MDSMVSIVPVTDASEFRLRKAPGLAGSVESNLPKPADLNQVKQATGGLWIPTYLPDGSALTWAGSTNPQTACLVFQKGAEDRRLFVMQNRKRADMRVMANMFVQTLVGNAPAYIVRGGWVAQTQRPADVFWSEDICLTLVAQRQGWVIRLEGHPASAWASAELVRIAESLQPF